MPMLSFALPYAQPPDPARISGSADRGYVRTHQGGGLLVNAARTAIAVPILKVRKRLGRRDGVVLIVTVIVKGHMDE